MQEQAMNRVGALTIGLVALVALAVLWGVFWLFDFQAAQSESSVRSEVSTGSTESGDELFRQGRWRAVHLYVPGEDDLARSLRAALRQQLATGSPFAEVVLLDRPSDTAESLLVVEVKQSQTSWAGLSARANVQAEVSYSTSGRVYVPGEAFVFTSDNPGIVVTGQYTLEDGTTGLVSRPAYFRLLGEELAAEVAKSLTEQLRARAS